MMELAATWRTPERTGRQAECRPSRRSVRRSWARRSSGLADSAQAAELAEAMRADGMRVSGFGRGGGAGGCSIGAPLAHRLGEGARRTGRLETFTSCAGRGARRRDPGRDGDALRRRGPRSGPPGVTDWLERPFSTIYARARVRAWLLRTACRWMRAPLPADEDRRLAAVGSSGHSLGEPEQRFNELTRRAAALFDVPSLWSPWSTGKTNGSRRPADCPSCGKPRARLILCARARRQGSHDRPRHAARRPVR